jgi:hypothetical protein
VLDSQLHGTDALHYTVVQSHSIDDFETLKSIWLEAIDKARAVMKRSADEEVTAVCLDFFRVN